MMNVRGLFVTVAWAVIASRPATGQVIPAGTPTAVVRRISQAIWPDQLFDTLGRPEPGFAPVGGAPLFTSLSITHRQDKVARLPGVEFYFGGAAGNCFDCGARVVAVATRGDTAITLQHPADLARLPARFGVRFAQWDSVGIREFVLELLNASCLAGCPADLLGAEDRIGRSDSVLARPVTPTTTVWRRSATFTNARAGVLQMEFVVLIPRHGIWTAKVTQGREGGYLDLSLDQVAALELYP